MSASDVTLEVPPDATVATAVVKADTTGVATRGSFADLKVLNTKGIRVSVRNL